MAEMGSVAKRFVGRTSPLFSRWVLGPFFRKHLAVPEGAALLEVGCGTGQAALMAHEMYRPAKFVVTDYDASQVERARETFQRRHGDAPAGVSLDVADGLALRYPAGSFDAVFAFLVLHHLGGHGAEGGEKMLDGVREADRVLKPGGQFVYAEIVNKRAVRDLLTSLGYKFVSGKRFLALIELAIARKPIGAAASSARP